MVITLIYTKKDHHKKTEFKRMLIKTPYHKQKVRDRQQWQDYLIGMMIRVRM